MVEMTDFYSVLQRAVSSLPDGSGPNRRAVYDKARKALLKQLQSFDPPLPSSDVTSQRLALEDAIRKIENEIARQIRTQRALQTAIPKSGTAKSGGANIRARAENGETVSPAAAAAAASAAAARAAEEERAAQRAADAARAREEQDALLKNAITEATFQDEPFAEDEADLSPVEDGPHDPLRTAPATVAPQAPAPRQAHEAPDDAEAAMFETELDDAYADADPYAASPAGHPDIVDGEYDEVDPDFEPTSSAQEVPQPPASDPKALKAERQAARKNRKDEERRLKADARNQRKADRKSARSAKAKPARKRGKRGGVLVPLVILALFAGAAYALYTQSGALLAVLNKIQEDPADRPPITVIGEPVEKNDDRLPSTLDGEETRSVTTTTWPPQGEGAGQANGEAASAAQPLPEGVAPASRTVGTEVSPFAAEAAPSAAEAQTGVQDPSATPAAPADGDQSSAEQQGEAQTQLANVNPAETGTTPQTVPEPPTSIVEFTPRGTQQAVLYEEALQTGEQGSAFAGGVEWSMVRQSIGGNDPEPVIRATARIPERNMITTITIRENRDGALPASHLIEIEFDMPEGDAGGIQNVPGMIMKASESSRGDALRGAAARVSSGLFWVALSESQTDRDNNLLLLREREWIDIPMVYENGRRAILTLRKGSDGLQSVNAAINAWGQG
ncbi:MAG: hypothetical protein AAGJ94_13575 [Pseudomonadota bacterium]